MKSNLHTWKVSSGDTYIQTHIRELGPYTECQCEMKKGLAQYMTVEIEGNPLGNILVTYWRNELSRGTSIFLVWTARYIMSTLTVWENIKDAPGLES